MEEVKKNERGNIILALALMKHLYNKGKLAEHIYHVTIQDTPIRK